MTAKRMFQLIVVAALLVTSFASAGGALAWSSCANYVTVQWGDTLSGIARLCGTTVEAIQAANPGLGWWVYAGQVLCIPTGYTSAPVSYPMQTGNALYPSTYGGQYVVQQGDTLGMIAASRGITVGSILAVNPQIQNASLIYTGQVINLPAGVSVPSYPPPPTYPPSPTYPPATTSSYSTIKIVYKYGLYIRSTPGGGDIVSSAVNKTYWKYNTGSIYRDANGKVWVEVKLGEMINGRWTGWILVKDNLGKYFTDPAID